MEINERTKMPINWFFGIVASFGSLCMVGVGALFYIYKIEAKANVANDLIIEQRKELDEIKKTWQNGISDISQYLRTIDQRLSRIEGQINHGGNKNGK